jgi:hypothetical protein
MTPLVGGPYRTPRVKVGHPIGCLVRGEVSPDGLTDGPRTTVEGYPIAWPYIDQIGGHRSLILCADLVTAVKAESVTAVMECWGVSRKQVYRWRRTLGVGRMNAGTRALWAAIAPGKLKRARAAIGKGKAAG